MPGYWPCDGKSEAKFEENAVRTSKSAPSKILRNALLYRMWENAEMCCEQWQPLRFLLQDCKEVPVCGSCQQSSRRVVSFSCLLLSVVMVCHEVLDGERCQSLLWNLCFTDLEMFGANHERMVGLGGAVAWRPQGKFMRNFRSSEDSGGNSEIWMYLVLQESVLLRLSELFLRKRGTLVCGRMCFGFECSHSFQCMFGTCLGLKGGMKALCLNVWTLQILLDPYRIWKWNMMKYQKRSEQVHHDSYQETLATGLDSLQILRKLQNVGAYLRFSPWHESEHWPRHNVSDWIGFRWPWLVNARQRIPSSKLNTDCWRHQHWHTFR